MQRMHGQNQRVYESEVEKFLGGSGDVLPQEMYRVPQVGHCHLPYTFHGMIGITLISNASSFHCTQIATGEAL